MTLKKDFYKLKNNALFGKTMENVRKRQTIRVSNTCEQSEILASKPNLKSFTIVSNDIVVYQFSKTSVTLDRPIYIGQCVLDDSKLTMYDLFYEKLKPTFENRERDQTVTLCGGDTDSFFLCLKNLSLSQEVLPELIRQRLLDTSNYPCTHRFHSDLLRAKLGCIKDESAGFPHEEWIFLRPKLYSMKVGTGGKKAAKGIQKAVLQSEISHEDYVQAFELLKDMSVSVRRIASRNHRVFTIEQQKRALSVWEDKRAWIEPNKSLPYGHYALGHRASKRHQLQPPELPGGSAKRCRMQPS